MFKKKIVFVLVIIPVVLLSQINKVENSIFLYKKGNFEQAVKEINFAANNSYSKKLAMTWYYRGQIYQALYQKNENNVYGLDSAYVSLIKALKLDADKKYLKNIIIQFKLLSSNYYRRGAIDFNNEKYVLAYRSFEKALDINKTPLVAKADTMLIFYSAKAAQFSNKLSKAKKHYNKLVCLKCTDPDIYINLGDIYKNENNSTKAAEIYSKGFSSGNQKNMELINKLVNIYLTNGQTSEALKYIDAGRSVEPDNASFYFYKAELYKAQKQDDKARNPYIEGLKYEPGNYNANQSLGIILYNSAVRYKIEADKYKESNLEKYKTVIKKYNNEIMQALKYLEIAYKMNQKDRKLNYCLIEVYKLLNRDDDYKRIIVLMKANGID